MKPSHHTQPGTFIRLMLSLSGLMACTLLLTHMSQADDHEAARTLLTLAIVCVTVFSALLAAFHSLALSLSKDELRLTFGFGWIEKRFAMDQIDTANRVKTRWYHGFGIKKYRGSWLYNISGFDAVEIRLKNQREYRIGTDESERLLAATRSALDGRTLSVPPSEREPPQPRH